MIKEGCDYLSGLLFSSALPWCLSSHHVCELDLCSFRLHVFFFLLLSDVHQAGSICHLCVRALQASCNKSITCCFKRLQGNKMRHYGASHSASSAWHRDEKNVKSFHYKEALLHFLLHLYWYGCLQGKGLKKNRWEKNTDTYSPWITNTESRQFPFLHSQLTCYPPSYETLCI